MVMTQEKFIEILQHETRPYQNLHFEFDLPLKISCAACGESGIQTLNESLTADFVEITNEGLKAVVTFTDIFESKESKEPPLMPEKRVMLMTKESHPFQCEDCLRRFTSGEQLDIHTCGEEPR